MWVLTRSGDGAPVVTHPKALRYQRFAKTC
jgi:hypothetical protein